MTTIRTGARPGRRLRPLHCALQLAIAAMLPVTASAQQAPGAVADPETAVELDRMVVTAQKREQQVQEVPIAITAYSGEFMKSLGVSTMGDLSGYVPGLQVQEQSPNNPGFVIRGITSDSGAANVPARVSIFQDGVSLSRSRGASVELFDMERVEILRGPQGTLFGRAAEIGAVHLIQNKANGEFGGEVELGLGNYNQRRFSGVLNAPIADQALYARLAVFGEQYDGTVDNLSGGDLNGKDTRAVRGSLGMLIGEMSRIDLIFNYQRDTPPGTDFRSGTIPNRRGSTDLFGPADLNRGDELGLDRKVYGATVLGDFALSDNWTLDTISGWRHFESTEQFDADGSQIAALEFAEIAEGKQFSQEFRFNYDAGGAFAGFFGASYFFEDGSQTVPFTTDERSLLALLSHDPNVRAAIAQLGLTLPEIPVLLPDGTPNVNYPLPPLPLPLNPAHSESFSNYGTTQAWDVFADGTWRVNDRFELTAGLRFSREDIEAGYQADPGSAPSLLGGLGAGVPMPGSSNILNLATNGRLTRSGSFDSAVGRLVGRYAFSDTLSGYASISRGRRPEAFNLSPTVSEKVPAETVDSYEIGLKGSLGGNRFAWDVAAFRYEYSNFQTDIPNPSGGTPLFITTNAGNATATGVEVAMNGELAPGLVGFLNYAWIDATFDDRDDDGNPQAFAGNRFRLTPEHSASLGLDWQLPFGAGHAFYLRPSYTWQSRVFFEDDNTAGLEQDAYGLFNLRAGVRLDDGRWDIGIWGRNLADKEYLIDAGNTGRLFGTPTYIPGSPRMYGITARLKF